MKRHEPERFQKIKKIMLPKDYLAYRLCGTFCTDVSDASGNAFDGCRKINAGQKKCLRYAVLQKNSFRSYMKAMRS